MPSEMLKRWRVVHRNPHRKVWKDYDSDPTFETEQEAKDAYASERGQSWNRLAGYGYKVIEIFIIISAFTPKLSPNFKSGGIVHGTTE